ncbi:MAG TPA: carbohydrate-binding protein [Clostridiales bacterium]|nr:carbohydrate-binding protein [Clostridiales bacterium]
MPRVNKTTATFTNSTEYLKNGLSVSPAIPSLGDKLTVQYSGLLAQSGASHIYAHVGYGSNWDNLYDYPMNRTDKGFEVNIPVVKSGTINVCFKDCANNWDNNSGSNYAFDVVQ